MFFRLGFQTCAIASCLSTVALPAWGQVFDLSFAVPQLDRWNYPLNATPGYRGAASTFSAVGSEVVEDDTFDQRDAQVLIRFDTAGMLPQASVGENFCFSEVVLTIAVNTDDAFLYDPTYDAFVTHLDPLDSEFQADSDPGRPLELFGAAFRGTNQSGQPWTPLNYYEGTSVSPGPPFGPSIDSDVRFVYPTDFPGGQEDDVSNNIRDRFDPTPFAIGRNPSLDLALQSSPSVLVPANTDIIFTLDTSNGDIQQYLREAAAVGRLYLMITSLQPASFNGQGGGSGQFASFYMKENFFSSGRAARLVLRGVLSSSGDLNSDDLVDINDLNLVLGNFGTSSVQPGEPGDANCDGNVDITDLNIVLGNFGS